LEWPCFPKKKEEKPMRNFYRFNKIQISIYFIAFTLWMGEAAAVELKFSSKVQQITFGPGNHFFGYVGHALTIPWNQSGRYIIALKTGFYNRMPKTGEAAEIVLLDTKENYNVLTIDKTYAWNLQQGTMLYWNPNAPETQFFFNDLDPETGFVFTVLYDIKKRKRVREYRYGNESIANGGIAPGGKYFAGINYGKITRSRKVIQYAGATDWTVGGEANPENDGLFKIDIKTGERHLMVSYKRLAAFLKIKDPDYPIYVHHTLWNRNSDRIIFIVRGKGNEDLPNKWPNAGCVIRSDGSGLSRIEYDGHPEWGEENLLSLPGKDFFKLYNVDTKKVVGKIGDKGVFPTPRDDNVLSPDGKWYVGSNKPTRISCVYTFYRLADGAYFRSPAIRTKADRSVTRIDPAPRWNRTSDAILAPGVAADGSRQLFVLKIFQKINETIN
jgi:hypothetical protein